MRANEMLLVMRLNIIRAYKRYEYILAPLIRFLFLLFVLYIGSTKTGYQGVLANPMIMLLIAFVASFLPDEGLILGAIILAPMYLIPTNPILSLILFIILAIFYVIFMRLFPKESIFIVVTVIALQLKIGIIVPFIAALVGPFVSIVAIIFGVFLCYAMPQFANVLETSGWNQSHVLTDLQSLSLINSTQIFADEAMISTMIIFIVVFLVIYFIHNQMIDYAPYVAIGIGAVMNIAISCLMIVFLKSNLSIVTIVVQSLGVSSIAIVVAFFSKVLDYERAELVKFEDEDNYYVVRVIPKVNVTTGHRKVKRVYNAKVEKAQNINIAQDQKEQDM